MIIQLANNFLMPNRTYSKNITVPSPNSCVNTLMVTFQHKQCTGGSLILSMNMLTKCETYVIKMHTSVAVVPSVVQ